MPLKKRSLIVAILILALACKEKVETNNIFRFRDYISYTTTGIASIADPIQIGLAKPVDGWEAGQEINPDIITVSPHVNGKITVVNGHTFTFTPNEFLNPATEYTVNVNLNKIYNDIPKDFKTYTFQFKTITPSFTVITNNLQSYSKNWQYINATIRSADVLSIQQAKQLVQAFQDKKKLPLVFNEYNQNGKIFDFKIDSINRKIESSNILVKWNGNAIKSKNNGENTLTIPGIENFTIVNIDVVQYPEQYLSLNFSDPLKKQQNFEGLVSLQDVKNPKYIVEGNVLKVYPDTRLAGNIQVNVFQGILSTNAYKLKTAFSETIAFESIKPQVRLVNNGVILPNSQDLKFNFEAVNLKAVDVRIIKIFQDNILQFLQENQLNNTNPYDIKRVGRRIAKQTIQLQTEAENTGKWKAYSIDLSQFFKADAGAIYRVELSFNKNYSLYNCNTATTSLNQDTNDTYYDDAYYGEEAYDDNQDDEELREEAYWDNLTYRYKNYTYNWQEENNPCHDAYYGENKIISQNLLASNLGVIAKKGANGSYYFAVTNILTTAPEANATIRLYNYQQQELASRPTDEEGLTLFDIDKNAAFAIVSKGNNTTYIKLDDGNSLSLSKFDISGNRLQRGLKGYIYGERGVWRPGDTLHLNFMLNDIANPLPNTHPVKMEITDPNGKLVYKNSTTENLNKLYTYTVPTASEDKTGTYAAKVSVGGASFYKSLKIETVKPNRLKMKLSFNDTILTKNNPIQATLAVNWLHGATAKNLKAEISAKISRTNTAFKGYKNYEFNDPTRQFNTEEHFIYSGKVNDNGLAAINKSVEIGKNAPGMLNVQFLVRAFENGGDFSIDAFTKQYAPYQSFLGLRSPEAKAYDSFFTDQDQTFDVIALDAQGNPIQRNNIEVKVYKIEWRWWWNASYDNLSSYVSSTYHQPYLNVKINTDAKGRGRFNLNIPDNERGRYLIRVSDPVSGHATGRTAYFYKNWYSPAGNKDAAKMLVFSANKETYNVGETATVKFQSGSDGRALVSIENGTEVLSYKWIKTQQGETSVQIPVTSDMAPNVFINISLLQPHAITANDLPIRLYGVIPLMVEDPSTKLAPEIKMPDVLRPEQDFEVTVSEKNNKSMTYTLAIVEEGLLDLTRFKTPNAWNEFYKREALGVRTWDVFDDVIGAYSGSIDQVFAIGGDSEALGAKTKKANRFKPIVKVLGPFNLQAGKRNTHHIKIPNYIGAVRTMVVAGNNTNKAYGSTDKSVQVKKPLMVLASLPRKLSSGEKVTLPVTVFAMEPKVKNVTLNLKLSNGISVVGQATKNLTFAKPDEQMAYFELDVSQAKGIATIEVLASGNGEKSSYKVELEVLNPNPISSQSVNYTVTELANKNIEFSTFGETGTNLAFIEFSTLPPMDFTRRMEYLIQYPHGCVEQLTSSVFPQLFLGDVFDLTYNKKQAIEKHIKLAINKLGHFQKPNGGLSYWLGENTADDWGTSYAGHFMLEAEKKGYVLPLTFKTNWLSYQREAASSWQPAYRTYNSDLAQAYRLYTLALAGNPDLAAMNRLREFSQISNEAKWRLAAAYALVGQNEAADMLSKSANIAFKPTAYNYYTYGSADRNRAMALETMVLTKNSDMRELATTIAKNLSSKRWMSTQTTAYNLLAMAKMVAANGGKAIKLSYTINGKTEQIDTKSAIAQRNLNIADGVNTITINNKLENIIYTNIVGFGKLPLGKELTEQRGLTASVSYTDLHGNKIDVSKLQQGQDFIAKVSITNLKDLAISNLALSQIFPSGWEIVNTRFTDYGDTTTSQARYIDIRDNCVNFYFDLPEKGKHDTKTFSVMLNASYLGTYYLPGIQAEAMYDNDFFVRNKGQWVTISN